jgi:1-acyl-sn-glycerol-3-phosphate acyltransferase
MAVVARHVRRACRLGGIEWSVLGTEHLPGEGHVIMHNELSMPDLLMLHGVVLRDYAELTVGADEWAVMPGTRRMCDIMGIELFRRGDRTASDRFLADLAVKVRDGARLSWAGPGKLSPDGEVQRFKRGGAIIAIRAGAPIVPLAIKGSWEIMETGSMRMRPGSICLQFGPSIDTSDWTEERAAELAEHVRTIVAEMYAEGRPS